MLKYHFQIHLKEYLIISRKLDLLLVVSHSRYLPKPAKVTMSLAAAVYLQ